MHRYAVALAIAVFAACSSEADAPEAEPGPDTLEEAPAVQVDPTTTEEENVALLRDAYDAFAAGDLEVVLAIMSPEIEWTEAQGGTFVGPDAVTENVFVPIGEEWSRYEVEPREFVADGNKVVVLGEYRGTHGTTALDFTAPFAHVWTIEDGKVARFRQFTDTEQISTAAGL